MICITGDTHGDWMSRLNASSFPEQKEMTKNDSVIILGDFGIWNDSVQENYNLNWLEDKPFTTLFIDGNHENYDILDSLPVEQWNGGDVSFIRPSVIHLKRGQVFTLEGKKFFTFGGAGSHDIKDGILEIGDPKIKLWRKDYSKLFRINHVSWWERELPSDEEMTIGLQNLAATDNKVDYILSHSPSTSLLYQIDGGYGLFGLYKLDALTDYLKQIKQQTEYVHWYFGHMHINECYSHEKATCLFEQIIRIM